MSYYSLSITVAQKWLQRDKFHELELLALTCYAAMNDSPTANSLASDYFLFLALIIPHSTFLSSLFLLVTILQRCDRRPKLAAAFVRALLIYKNCFS